MEDGKIQQLSAIAGLSSDDAKTWLDMAGGDLNAAMNLLFGDGGGMGGGDVDMLVGGGDGNAQADVPDWHGLVWPSPLKTIADCWLGQGFEFSKEPGSRFGILQPKNGPCGLLAVLQSVLAVQNLHQPGFGPDFEVSDTALASAIAAILAQCIPEAGSLVRVAAWSGTVGAQVAVTDADPADGSLSKLLVDRIADFRAAGGAILLLYSAVLTRGPERVRKDIAMDAGSPPLVSGANWLCTFELMSLLMRGKASGNVGAYNQTVPGAKVDWEKALGVGLLSQAFESQTSLSIADTLKSPASEGVWIAFGGDHFTTLFAGPPDLPPSKPQADGEVASPCTLHHWNGLPPAGPRMTTFSLLATKGACKPAADVFDNTFFKPIVGEIDSIVQADPEEKKVRPKEWQSWRYEVVLARDDPDVQGAERPKDQPLPSIFDQGALVPGPWRCTSCYATRFKTMCFGQNEAGAETCRHCEKRRPECGWSIWMRYSELPPGWQRTCTAQHAPKIYSLLGSKWPGCEVQFSPGQDPPSI